MFCIAEMMRWGEFVAVKQRQGLCVEPEREGVRGHEGPIVLPTDPERPGRGTNWIVLPKVMGKYANVIPPFFPEVEG